MFPEAFPQNGSLPQPRVDETNFAYDGWFVQTDNLFFANGHRASRFSCVPSLPCAACCWLTCVYIFRAIVIVTLQGILGGKRLRRRRR